MLELKIKLLRSNARQAWLPPLISVATMDVRPVSGARGRAIWTLLNGFLV
jgi:hypothetical protein